MKNRYRHSNEIFIRRLVVAGLSGAVFIAGLACIPVTDSSDRVLFGLTDQLAGPYNSGEDLTGQQAACTSTSDIVVSETAVELDEGGDVTRSWSASDPGFSDVDGDNTGDNAGGSWGQISWEVCVYLPTAFDGTVTIPVSENSTYAGRLDIQTSHPAAGSPLPTELIFTGDGTTGHGTASRQCITIARVDDGVQNAVEEPRIITLGTITSDTSGVYSGQDPCDISVTMEDDESPGVRVSNISNVMQEPGTGGTNNGTFNVKLRTTPAANVTVGINDTFDSTNAGQREGIATPTSLTFNDTTAQTVTVNSVDDLEIDGLKTYIIDVTTASSADANYNGIEPRNVVVYNEDQSVPGYTYTLFDATTGETGTGGGTISGFAVDQQNNMGTTYASFTLGLRSKPTDNVTLTFSNSDPTIATLNTTSLTFTPSNWNVKQSVTVQGNSDGADNGTGNGNEDITISFVAASSDSTYNTTVSEPVFTVRSCDNDNTKLIQPCNFSGSPFGDARSGSSRFSSGEPSGTSAIWLISKNDPGGTATVGTTSTDTSEGTVPASVTIDSSNYNTMSTGGTNRIVITHVDDGALDGTQNFSITTAAATGTLTYNTSDIEATTTDNEQTYYISRTGNTSEASGATVATIYVCLGASPTATVTLTPTVTANADEFGGTFSPTSISWSAGQQSDATSNATCTAGSTNVRSFTVNGADDSFADGNVNFTVSWGGGAVISGGTDTTYDGASPANQSITNVDDEPPGKAIFVTTNLFNGEMTAAGVQGADTICNNASNKPSGVPSGTYKALIAGVGETNTRRATSNGTDATGQTDWALTAGNYYYRCEAGGASNCSDENTRLFIADSNALFNPNGMSRDFSSTGSHEFWTGMNTNLTIASQTSTPAIVAGDPADRDNCAGFTYQNGPGSPFNTYYAETWSNGGGGTISTNTNVACTNTRRVICVQQ